MLLQKRGMEVNMNGLYDSITKKNTKPPFDIPLTAIITLLPLSALAMLISVIFLMNCNRRFLAFVSDLSNSTTYAYQHESLTAMADGCSYKISGKNMYGIYTYIAMGKSGRESKKTPDGEPVVLSYGDGSTLKLWDLPDPQEENRHNLFIHYTDKEGNVFSYINYRMTLETMMIRYLKYGNNEVLG